MERRRLIGINAEQYEELTSIWSTNGGYFLTGILPSIGHDKLEVKFQNRTAQSSYGKMICCAMEVYSSFMCVLDSGTYRKWSVRAGNNYTNNGPSVNYNVHIAVVDTVNDIYKIDTTNQSVTRVNYENQSVEMGICIYNGNSNPQNTMYDGKIYYFKYWRDGVLIADMVPVKRKSDNAVGMYDVIRDMFIQSAGGTFVYA